MNKAIETKELGQSIWYDNIDRKDIESGAMQQLAIDGKAYGVTSNPSIFEKSISQGSAYDLSLQAMAWAGLNTEQIYSELVKQDIQMTAEIFNQVFESTQQLDGYISVEIDPTLANETEKSIYEGKTLWAQINRKNLMIKVPATLAGLPVIRALISEGINVNATLIFSIERYEEVIEAYLLGLEDRLKKGLPVSNIHSVASFFVSRIDTAVDKLLQKQIENGANEAQHLLGKIAVDNAKLAYQAFKSVFSSSRFEKLAQKGAQIQRPLWASTGTKNPNYSDCLYVDELIGLNTVNTIPTATLSAFLDHGKPELRIENDIKTSIERLDTLNELGIDLDKVTAQLEDEGVRAFQKAHESLLNTIELKRQKFSIEVKTLNETLISNIKAAATDNMVRRLFENDPTLWTDNTGAYAEIRNRLGWLSLPGKQIGLIKEYDVFRQQLLEESFTDVVVLGMGGSSLAPEVMAQSFTHLIPKGQGLRLRIIDTTNPAEIQKHFEAIDLEHTLIIVASKSGSTSETMAAYRFFKAKMDQVFREKAGSHFVAITDPGSSLAKLAEQNGFRAVFYAPENVGGRFSVFTPFGLLPAALIGLDMERFIKQAHSSDLSSRQNIAFAANANLMLGLVLATAAQHNRNKLSFVAEDFASNLVPWLEQLIAESSGKDGKGILPIEGEPVLQSMAYPDDRLFVYFEVDSSQAPIINALREKGYPVLGFKLETPYDLAKTFYQWEYATAIACASLKVNAFDQPDVQTNKLVTKRMIEDYKKTGSLSISDPIFSNSKVNVYGLNKAGIEVCGSVEDIIALYAKDIPEGGYIAINAFLPRLTNEIDKMQGLRAQLLNQFNVATTLGFGPRFLHSTGQYHKGGPDGGLYLIFTGENVHDIDIPGENMTFGTLQLAQALGDYEVLLNQGKTVLRIDLKRNCFVN